MSAMHRRDLLQKMAAVPFLATWSQESIWAADAHRQPLEEAGDTIYASIGVEPIINCRGTFTIIGGSIERPEVGEAMEAATGYFVQYDELAYGVGKRLAELVQCEWGIVTSGCAAALKHITAACVTGGNPEKLLRIPDLTGFDKTEVIVPRQSRNAYDHAVRNIGVTIVEVSAPEELERAINPRTAMIYLVTGPSVDADKPLSLEAIARIAKPYGVPILADAAAEDLTIPPIHLARGATVVAYSGGKAICGPQCAGLAFGPKELLMAAWQASSPHHGPGRDNKVGKEEIMGMLAAVEAWTSRDHLAEWNTWLQWLETIASTVRAVAGVETEVTMPQGLSNRAPVLHIRWNADQLHISGEEVAESTARKRPRIALGSRDHDGKASVQITPSQMRPEQVTVVANRLYEILAEKRTPKTTSWKTPASKLDGVWDLEIQYFTSKSKHKLSLEQDGNWLAGYHQAEFAGAEIVGIVDGDEVKMSSVLRMPGDHIPYMFEGKIDAKGMSGTVFLGEYLTATFTATRNAYRLPKKDFLIPSGPPLAT